MGELIKFCICSTHSKSYHGLAELTLPNHLQYAWKHGYDYNSHIAETKSDTVYFNAALILVKDILKNYDYVMTVGVDVLFMNQGVTIENIIQSGAEQQIAYERIGGSEYNNDVMIWKNCESTYRLLDKLLAEKDKYVIHPVGWQDHICDMFANKDAAIKSMIAVNADVMNNIGWPNPLIGWKPGNYIAHFFCADLSQKIDLAKEYLPKVI